MTEIKFSRLENLPLRDAWAHEAHKFTPWLADNIDHLGDAIGIRLELSGQEVPVGSFAADILARRSEDDAVVLIENQLEQTDHTHLGQIMTYLAGLDARVVIWVAPLFQEPHLAAIRWLNEHTAEGFSFFAVRLRVVRIEDSPYAPVFEVVESPNGWTQAIRKSVSGRRELKSPRYAYWSKLHEILPKSNWERWRQYTGFDLDGDLGLYIGLWATGEDIGIYIHSTEDASPREMKRSFGSALGDLERRLGPAGNRANGTIFSCKGPGDISDETKWDEMLAWHSEMIEKYQSAIEEALESRA
jgi:hypothetical protein